MPKKSYSRKRVRKKRTSFRKNKRKQKTRKSKRRTMRKQVGSGYYKCPGDFEEGCPHKAYHFSGFRGNTGWWAGKNIDWLPAAGYWSGQRADGKQMKGEDGLGDSDERLCPECFKVYGAAVTKLLEFKQQNDQVDAGKAARVQKVNAAAKFSASVAADMAARQPR
jgi:hypothetical protein